MNIISTPWSCNRCGGAFISTPPEHGLCRSCADEPGSSGWTQPRGYDAHLDALRCPACGALPMRELAEMLRDAYELGMQAHADGATLVLSDPPAGVRPIRRRTRPGGRS